MIVPCCSATGEARFGCAQAGCAACQEVLLRENAGLVWMTIERQWRGLAEFDDLQQEGRIGLWQAIMGYDPERGYRFSSYAVIAIRNQIWRAVARSLKATGWEMQERGEELLAVILSDWQSAQIHEALQEELDSLPAELRQVVILHDGWEGREPQSFSELGKARGVSRQRMHQLYHKALVLLRVPALSIRLRSLCSLESRKDYLRAGRENRDYYRKYGVRR